MTCVHVLWALCAPQMIMFACKTDRVKPCCKSATITLQAEFHTSWERVGPKSLHKLGLLCKTPQHLYYGPLDEVKLQVKAVVLVRKLDQHILGRKKYLRVSVPKHPSTLLVKAASIFFELFDEMSHLVCICGYGTQRCAAFLIIGGSGEVSSCAEVAWIFRQCGQIPCCRRLLQKKDRNPDAVTPLTHPDPPDLPILEAG